MLAAIVALGLACGPADDVAAWLRSDFGESVFATARDAHGVIEIWANPKTRTLTIARRVGDVRCLILTGAEWSPVLGI